MPNATVIPVILLLCAGLGACDQGNTAHAKADAQRMAPADSPLRVVVARPSQARPGSITLPATTQAWHSAMLHSRVNGYIASMAVDIGDRVHRGQTLARIEVPEAQAAFDAARAKANLDRAKLKLARLTSHRLEQLRKANADAASQQQVDEAAGKAQAAAARVKVDQAEAAQARVTLELATLRAPFDGVITQRMLDPGALVRAGTVSSSQPILAVVDADPIRVFFEVPETQAPQVQAGAPVSLRFDAFPAHAVNAHITRIAKALDPKTLNMRAEVDLPNPKGRYLPGMYASVSLPTKPPAGALSVPADALRGHEDDFYVFVAKDGVLHKTPVIVASNDGQHAIIAHGLEANQQVVIAGSELAQNGSKVRAVEDKKL